MTEAPTVEETTDEEAAVAETTVEELVEQVDGTDPALDEPVTGPGAVVDDAVTGTTPDEDGTDLGLRPGAWEPVPPRLAPPPPVAPDRTDEVVADHSPAADGGDGRVAPVPQPERELVSAAHRRPVIDWSGAGHAVEEQVRTSDDILAASEATALPEPVAAAATGGSELARLLAKVEARLREYD